MLYGKTHATPEEVITSLRQSDEYMRLIFMNGGCWQFYKFLALIFPEAKPFKVAISNKGNYDHVITRTEYGYYDISGRVYIADFLSFAPIEAEDVPKFEQWNFSCKNLLFKRCPHCGEEIRFTAAGEIKN